MQNRLILSISLDFIIYLHCSSTSSSTSRGGGSIFMFKNFVIFILSSFQNITNPVRFAIVRITPMTDKKEPIVNPVIEDEDKPHYQESITFIVSVVAQTAILIWCLVVLSLGYVKLPNNLFGMEIPDQPRVDSTFAAGLLGNILAGMGVSVNAAANGNGKKKKREEEAKNNGGSSHTIIIKQPLEILAPSPQVSKDK